MTVRLIVNRVPKRKKINQHTHNVNLPHSASFELLSHNSHEWLITKIAHKFLNSKSRERGDLQSYDFG